MFFWHGEAHWTNIGHYDSYGLRTCNQKPNMWNPIGECQTMSLEDSLRHGNFEAKPSKSIIVLGGVTILALAF